MYFCIKNTNKRGFKKCHKNVLHVKSTEGFNFPLVNSLPSKRNSIHITREDDVKKT